jgi:hypothetical protein
LGVAEYLAGNWQAAIEALAKSMELRHGGDAFDWFFLAMGHWQLGHKDQARTWYDKGAAWMNTKGSQDADLRRFRAEAAQLLGIPQTIRRVHPPPGLNHICRSLNCFEAFIPPTERSRALFA